MLLLLLLLLMKVVSIMSRIGMRTRKGHFIAVVRGRVSVVTRQHLLAAYDAGFGIADSLTATIL